MKKRYNKKELDKIIIEHAKNIFNSLDLPKSDIKYLLSKKNPKQLYNLIELIDKEINTKATEPEGVGQVLSDIIKKEKAKNKKKN